MKEKIKITYCSQNNGDCTTCSLVSYNQDCCGSPLTGDPIEDKGNNKEDLAAIIEAAKEAISRIERYSNILAENPSKNRDIIEGLYAFNATRVIPIQ